MNDIVKPLGQQAGAEIDYDDAETLRALFVGHATNRETAVARLLAVAPNPQTIESLAGLVARCDHARLTALLELAATQVTAEQLRAIALGVRMGIVTDARPTDHEPTGQEQER
ncbi:hypothetical protein [Microbacterium sp. MMO-56]|uniref:hypothetical protein n=1 Tax=Microbacterium sp. MMO-56 TaxID=3081281 RepID=UPI003015AA4D